jgi:peptidoglycan/xylan/chitin deacetylase (PgdA/CDA1 family)
MRGLIRSPGLPVLIYHHVGPTPTAALPGLTVAPALFERQLRWIRRQGYRSVGIDEVAAFATEGGRLPRRSLMITFDDGYADLSEHALPRLIEHGLSAVVFVVTARIGARSVWDATDGFGGHPLMDASEIQRWSREGIEFGAHSRTHSNLDALDAKAAEGEIVGSRKELEEVLGHSVSAFAYPYGHDPGPEVLSLARRTFAIAFTALEGINRVGADPHLLRRTLVHRSDTALDLACRLRAGRSVLDPLRRFGVRTRIRAALTRSTSRRRER